MYQYTEFDKQFVHQRAAQFRDQLTRHLDGQLADEEFRALRLQNGWYIQRHAPMTRVAVPYGELSSRQLRQLAHIAREFDKGYAHFTTRHNCQYNWIPLERAADVMDLLADVDMHGIQTSGNCIRNISTDYLAGIAPDEVVDPRPYCEVIRQWSSLHPEFAFLPRKFKIAVTGATEDRVASNWYDIGLHVLKNDAGEVGFRVIVGGGMGRTPIIGTVVREFLPWQEILVYIEAIMRVYNRHGRRDNSFKARIKILVKALGEQFAKDVEEEFDAILNRDVGGRDHLIPQAEFDRVAACFVQPISVEDVAGSVWLPPADAPVAFLKWLERNTVAHRVKGYRAVTLSLKRVGQAPGDTTDAQMDAAADLADRFSCGEVRVRYDQNLLLPWVRESDLLALWEQAKAASFAVPNIGLLSDMIACPGGDFCALANARSIPIANALIERYQDLDELYDIGDINLHISGCINSCGHHHSGHIGILGVDKDGSEWYQVTLGGADGSHGSPNATPGKVIGPSFASDEVADVVEALIETYRSIRTGKETFLETVRRVGIDPFKAAGNAVRHTTAKAA
ncbi:MAG: nitrite/sulfite reductase [Aquabacterium sp.]|jgi:sulfite reductase (NADPH) hemoprotein beta-component|uniref:nitrite/sulfite reductase n=1 Tax=Aquabacterium sp. TaxID=1872578 RepID=UPI001B6315DC|nr:nitrite/sulfite reductase [Aquabacterium sp.]MBP7131581.1 nitrite/sulfite reductase [Aquabacterium sp.]MBP9063750.1 nitrite/sulfite reductase [Aquabacterium sp.]MDQ5926459.1 sulfite reductase hemoprotein beta-component [Pseudomonadota bacterium]